MKGWYGIKWIPLYCCCTLVFGYTKMLFSSSFLKNYNILYQMCDLISLSV